MKRLALGAIKFYQTYISFFIRMLVGSPLGCRFSLSCSEYAYKAVEQYGVVKGVGLSIKRLLSCQPFINRYDRAI